jgi:hypothetical protein
MLSTKSSERRRSNGPEEAQTGCWQEAEEIEGSVKAKEAKRRGAKEQTALA